MYNTILFLGLGGAGQRHLRVINKLIPNANYIAYRKIAKTPLLNKDFTINDSESIESKFNVTTYNDIDNAYNENPDLVIISNPTSLHSEAIIRAIEEGADVITEKPGSSSLSEAKSVKKVLENSKSKFLISYQRRFHPLTKELRKIIQENKLGNISGIDVSLKSNVKNWHPYEDYKELYACNSQLGGGVLLTESHEIDLILWIFGQPDKIRSKLYQKKNLDLDVEDSAILELYYKKFNVRFKLDFMSELLERKIEIKGT